MSTLLNKTILLTRTKESNLAVAQLFRQRGARVLSFPTIEVADPDSWESCDRAIGDLQSYDGVLFTSKNSVERLLRRIESIKPEAKRVLADRQIYAVGEKTERTLENAGLPVAMTPDVSSAEDLASLFEAEEVAGRRFLFPRSDIGRDILPNALRSLGGIVDDIVVYKTVPPRQGDLEDIRGLFLEGGIDIVTFFSPSSARNFVQMMGVKCIEGALVAVIGPQTAEAIREIGIEARIIAGHATAESLVDTIEEFLDARAPIPTEDKK